MCLTSSAHFVGTFPFHKGKAYYRALCDVFLILHGLTINGKGSLYIHADIRQRSNRHGEQVAYTSSVTSLRLAPPSPQGEGKTARGAGCGRSKPLPYGVDGGVWCGRDDAVCGK